MGSQRLKDWASFIFTYWFVFLCEMYVYTFVHFFPCCITLFFSRLIDIGLWVIFTHSGHFSSLIPRMPTFTLAISYLITSNLLWFMDLTFQVPMQYCSLQHRTLLLPPVTSTTGYCFCFGSIPSFFLVLFLHWSPVVYWHRPGEFLFQYPIILPFHIVHGVLKARILKWFAISFSSGPHSVRPLHHDPSILGGPTEHA